MVGDEDQRFGFDAEEALAAARSVIDENDLLICVAYDAETFRTVYADDRVDALYSDTDAREEHFGQVHAYVHLDFMEAELFEELFIDPGDVHAFVTYMDTTIAVRVVADGEGVYFVLTPEAAVTKLVDAVKRVLE